MSHATHTPNRFDNGKISSLLVEFAIPSIMGLVVNALYNIIDAIFLGHAVGELGIATTTVAMPITMLMMGIAMLVGVGGNSLAAIRYGEGDIPAVEKILGNSFTLEIIVSALIALVGILAIGPILAISGVTPESYEYSKSFIRILMVGFVFQAIGYGLNNFMRTAGSPQAALWTMVIGAGGCTVFNFIFVILLGQGVVGSAIATIAGQGLAAAFVVYYFLYDKKTPFKLYRKNLRLERALDRKILSFGSASFAVQFAATVVALVTNHLLIFYGDFSSVGPDGALASFGVVLKISILFLYPCVGVGIGMQPIIGYNFGAKNYDRVRLTVKTAVIWATILGTFFWVLALVFPSFFVGMFGIDNELMTFSVYILRIYLLALPLAAVQIIGGNYFQSVGQPRSATILTLLRQLIFLMPLFVLLPLVLPKMYGTDPIVAMVIASPVSDFLATTVTVIFLVRSYRRLGVNKNNVYTK